MAPENKPTAGSSDRQSRPPTVSSSSSDLWVGNLPADVSSSDLMATFSEFSPLDISISNTQRPYAFIYFKSADAAKAAKDSRSGSKIRGKPMKIDFSRPVKPSAHIWIGGLSAAVTETLLKESLSKFGRIKEFTLVRDRNSAFMDFCTIEEAVAVKNEMDGKVLDAEIRIDFQRPFQWQKGNRRLPLPPPPPPAPGRRGEVPSNTLWVGYPPSAIMDTQRLHNAMILFGEIERIKSFPERHYCFVDFRSVDEARRAKEGLQGKLFGDPRIQIMFSRSDFAPGKDTSPLLPGFPRMRPEFTFNPMGHLRPPRMPGMNMMMRPYLPQGLHPEFDGPNWRRPPPGPGLIPFSSEIRSSKRPIWDDEFDAREPKRSRDYGSPAYDEPFHGRRLDDELVRLPVRACGSPDIEDVWRGVIAKGGAHVCHARCVPIGKGLDFPLPEVVNCSARTDLEMLAKRYSESDGFDIVLFLPDSEADFASYTEFLRYLGLNSRAGVAKFDDGATLFLVPPSDFLTEVLKVTGPERLYGVVLKLPRHQQLTSVTPQRSQSIALPPPPHVEQQMVLEDGYITKNEGADYRMNYGSNTHESSMLSVGDREPHADASRVMPSAPHDYPRNLDGTSQIGVSLTPELVATLASLIPSNNQSSVAGNVQINSSNTVKPPSFPSTAWNDSPVSVQGLSQGHQGCYPGAQSEMTNIADQESQQLQQLGDQLLQQHQQQLEEYSQKYGSQPPLMSQVPPYGSFTNGTDNAGQPLFGSTQGRDHPALNMVRDSYESYDTRETLGALHAGVAFNQQVQYQTAPPVNSSAEDQTGRVLQNHLPSPTNSANYSSQPQQLQVAFNNSGSGPSEGSADQKQRYEATLQIAATLLQQIQREQQGSSRAVDGSENHQ